MSFRDHYGRCDDAQYIGLLLQQSTANASPTWLTTREQAASIASREPHYLSYLFRREMGKLNWRREHRTSVAIAALEEGQRSIDEIVKLVG